MNDRPKENTLFTDTTNPARSQIGEAWLRHYAGDQLDEQIKAWLKEQGASAI